MIYRSALLSQSLISLGPWSSYPIMAGLKSYNHHSALAPRTEFISDHDIALIISSRHERPQTITAAMRELPAPQVPAFGTTCRELIQLLAALVRTIFTLCVLPLVLFISACLSLSKILLQYLRGPLLDLSNWNRGLRNFVKSQICSRSFNPEEIIDLVIFSPIRITHAVLEFLEAKTRSLITSPSPRSAASSGIYVEDALAIKLLGPAYLPLLQPEYVQHNSYIPQTPTLATLDDIPTLEQHSIAGPAGKAFDQCRSASLNRFGDTHGCQIDALPSRNLPAQTDQVKDEVQIAGRNETGLERRELGAPMAVDSNQSSTDLLQSFPEYPKRATWPVHSSKGNRLERSQERRWQSHPGAPARRSNASSITSDPAKAESFSPIQFTLPRASRIYSWEGMRYISSYTSQSHDAEQPPSLTQDGPDASTSEHDRSSNPAESGLPRLEGTFLIIPSNTHAAALRRVQ